MLCPVRALKLYVDRSKVWRKSSQLLVCFGAGRRRLATSKQRISHWVRDAISLAYEAQNLPSPLSLRAHSTWGVASSQALIKGGTPGRYLCCDRMVLSTHFYQVLQPWCWYGSRFSDLVCLNWPYVVGSLLDQIGSVFSLACLVYRSQSVKAHAALSYLWKRTSRVTRVTLVLSIGNETLRLLPSSSRCRQSSFRQINLRSGWRVRQYKLTTWLRQRRRRAISQWIGVIL